MQPSHKNFRSINGPSSTSSLQYHSMSGEETKPVKKSILSWFCCPCGEKAEDSEVGVEIPSPTSSNLNPDHTQSSAARWINGAEAVSNNPTNVEAIDWCNDFKGNYVQHQKLTKALNDVPASPPSTTPRTMARHASMIAKYTNSTRSELEAVEVEMREILQNLVNGGFLDDSVSDTKVNVEEKHDAVCALLKKWGAPNQ